MSEWGIRFSGVARKAGRAKPAPGQIWHTSTSSSRTAKTSGVVGTRTVLAPRTKLSGEGFCRGDIRVERVLSPVGTTGEGSGLSVSVKCSSEQEFLGFGVVFCGVAKTRAGLWLVHGKLGWARESISARTHATSHARACPRVRRGPASIPPPRPQPPPPLRTPRTPPPPPAPRAAPRR